MPEGEQPSALHVTEGSARDVWEWIETLWRLVVVSAIVVEWVAPSWIKSSFGVRWDLTILAGLLAPLLMRRFVPRQARRVAFFEDRIAFFFSVPPGPARRWHKSQDLRWTEIAGFLDGNRDYVRIRERRRRFLRRPWAIPTPTEAERVAVVELLDRFGIPRCER